ncbi:MAG: hypothetical protein LBM13_06245 [Candidatus Ancillula sp.]|nr:hypothetical protein [Candidatus Ancillula sp.]
MSNVAELRSVLSPVRQVLQIFGQGNLVDKIVDYFNGDTSDIQLFIDKSNLMSSKTNEISNSVNKELSMVESYWQGETGVAFQKSMGNFKTILADYSFSCRLYSDTVNQIIELDKQTYEYVFQVAESLGNQVLKIVQDFSIPVTGWMSSFSDGKELIQAAVTAVQNLLVEIEKTAQLIGQIVLYESEINNTKTRANDMLNKLNAVEIASFSGEAKAEVWGSSGSVSKDFGNGVKASAEGDIDVLSAKAVADGKMWVDDQGNLCCDGSAEAEAILVQCKGKANFTIAGVSFDAEGKASVGASAAAAMSASIGKYGFKLSAKAEAQIGASAEGSVGYKIGSGFLSAGENIKGEAFAGAKASAEGKIDSDISDGSVGASGGLNAFAGAEASATPSAQVGPVDASCKIGVKAGAGVELNGDVGLDDGHLKIDLDIGAAVAVGVEIKPSIDIDIGGTVKWAEQTGQDVWNGVSDGVQWLFGN